MQKTQVWSLGRKDLLEKEMATTPVFLPGEFHGQRSLVCYSPSCCKELDTTEWLTLTKWSGDQARLPRTHKPRQPLSLTPAALSGVQPLRTGPHFLGGTPLLQTMLMLNPFLYLFHCKHKHFLVSLHPKNSTEGLTHSSCSQSLFQLTGLSRQAPSLLWSPAPPHSFLWLLHQTDSRACSTCFSHNWLCDPIDYSPLGSSVHGISHVHGMEWVAMPSSRGSS